LLRNSTSASAGESKRPVRILVADDSSSMRNALRNLLEEETGWVVCGEAANGAAAVEMAQELRPDLVLMDLAMPSMNGLRAAEILSTLVPPVPVVIVSNYALRSVLDNAKKMGVRGYVLKSEPALALLEAVRSAIKNQPVFPNRDGFETE
jgi:DNA-binding NarL/FixJ family response regulator